MHHAMTFLKLAIISLGCLLVGAAATCAVISGIESIPFSPLFAVFGWFFIFPIFGLVLVMWGLYGALTKRALDRRLFIPLGILIGGSAMASLGLAGWNSDPNLYQGLMLGGALAGGFATLAITVLSR